MAHRSTDTPPSGNNKLNPISTDILQLFTSFNDLWNLMFPDAFTRTKYSCYYLILIYNRLFLRLAQCSSPEQQALYETPKGVSVRALAIPRNSRTLKDNVPLRRTMKVHRILITMSATVNTNPWNRWHLSLRVPTEHYLPSRLQSGAQRNLKNEEMSMISTGQLLSFVPLPKYYQRIAY